MIKVKQKQTSEINPKTVTESTKSDQVVDKKSAVGNLWNRLTRLVWNETVKDHSSEHEDNKLTSMKVISGGWHNNADDTHV